MDNVFIVMAEERGYSSRKWLLGVFTEEWRALELRDKAQVRADAVHAKIRALGIEEGLGASWRDVGTPPGWEAAHEECEGSAWFEELHLLKAACFPEDPDASVEWDCTMHYEVQEWPVDSL